MSNLWRCKPGYKCTEKWNTNIVKCPVGYYADIPNGDCIVCAAGYLMFWKRINSGLVLIVPQEWRIRRNLNVQMGHFRLRGSSTAQHVQLDTNAQTKWLRLNVQMERIQICLMENATRVRWITNASMEGNTLVLLHIMPQQEPVNARLVPMDRPASN